MRVAVIGRDSAAFCREARRLLRLAGVELCRTTAGADALLLLDDCPTPLTAGVAAVRGDASCCVTAEAAVSYGMSPRDTITVSSVEESSLSLSVQREFPALDGRRVMIQELKLDWSLPPERALPIAALGLLVGELGESTYAASME